MLSPFLLLHVPWAVKIGRVLTNFVIIINSMI